MTAYIYIDDDLWSEYKHGLLGNLFEFDKTVLKIIGGEERSIHMTFTESLTYDEREELSCVYDNQLGLLNIINHPGHLFRITIDRTYIKYIKEIYQRNI